MIPRMPSMRCAAVATVLLAAHAAAAQPAAPAEPAAPPPPPLAQVKDDRQLAEILSSITQDPAIAVDNPATRPLAQALMTEGVKQLQARAYDQALANFLEAYARFPSPKILLNVASTLRDMGRLADAANTYQRYLSDPATGAERVAEVKDLLIRLDEQLAILTVRVSPRGSDISIDGGPFIAVGSSLVTRVRTGLHLVRIRKDRRDNEVTVNGFEGENKEVVTRVDAPDAPDAPAAPAQPAGPAQPAAEGPSVAVKAPAPAAPAAVPDRVDGWLITGTDYGASDAGGRERKVRGGRDGRVIAAIVPRYEISDDGEAIVASEDEIESGVIGVLRIDGKGRGFAGGLGIAIARGRYEFEVMGLMSDQIGGFLGGRFRLLTGFFRPYVAVGVPVFLYDHEETDGMTTTTTRRLAVGGRVAAGLELKINGHLSVQGDLGYEQFYFTEPPFEDKVFVPTLGVIGRL